MNTILYYSQIATSIILVILIIIQQRGAALGAGFGGGSGGGDVYSTKRGAQKKIYYATIAVASIFLVLGVLNILIQ